MRFLVQRVTQASVSIGGEIRGSIGRGFLVLIGTTHGDDRKTADRMLEKLLKLRIFEDENGKTNLSLDAVGGSLLLISQFTLYADCRRGNRPDFLAAQKPSEASPLFDYIVEQASARVPGTGCGVFGADMQVELVNDGPFTVMMDSAELFPEKSPGKATVQEKAKN